MECICIDCGIVYENGQKYKTCICDECFKKFNEHKLQPLKDELHEANLIIKKLKQRILELETKC